MPTSNVSRQIHPYIESGYIETGTQVEQPDWLFRQTIGLERLPWIPRFIPERPSRASFVPSMDKKTERKRIPLLSLSGAIGFALAMIVLVALESLQATEPSIAARKTRVVAVMCCTLFAAWSSIVSLITAWCPIILGGDRRPWLWVAPLLLGWVVFVYWFDLASLLPPRP